LTLKRLFNTYIVGLGIISLGLLFYPSNTFAQNNGHADEEYVDDGEEIENDLNDFRKSNKELTDTIQKMNSDGNISADEKKKLMEMYSSATGKGGKSGAPSAGKLDLEKFRPIIKQLNGQYGRMSYASAKGQIQSNIQMTPAKGLFNAFPKMIDFVTHLIRDNEAMISLLDMFKDIATILLGWVLKRRVSKEAAFSEKLTKWIMRKGIVIGLRFGILLLFFKPQIYPTWLIVKKVFL
jgi:hypothetical protein